MARGRTGPEDEDEGCGPEGPCFGFLSGGLSSLSSSLCLVLLVLDLNYHYCLYRSAVEVFAFCRSVVEVLAFCLMIDHHYLLILTAHAVLIYHLVLEEVHLEVVLMEVVLTGHPWACRP